MGGDGQSDAAGARAGDGVRGTCRRARDGNRGATGTDQHQTPGEGRAVLRRRRGRVSRDVLAARVPRHAPSGVQVDAAGTNHGLGL